MTKYNNEYYDDKGEKMREVIMCSYCEKLFLLGQVSKVGNTGGYVCNPCFDRNKGAV
jgi:hypothetical protein